jgi:hypothetical protein
MNQQQLKGRIKAWILSDQTSILMMAEARYKCTTKAPVIYNGHDDVEFFIVVVQAMR